MSTELNQDDTKLNNAIYWIESHIKHSQMNVVDGIQLMKKWDLVKQALNKKNKKHKENGTTKSINTSTSLSGNF